MILMGYKSNFIINALGGESSPKVRLSVSDINIVFDGDSITDGNNNCGTLENRFPSEMSKIILPLCKTFTYDTVAVGGQTTKNMLRGDFTDASTKVVAGKVNVLVASESVNAILNYDLKGDINGAATAQINFNDFTLYDEKMRLAGYDYIIRWTCFYPRKINASDYNRAEWTQQVRDRQTEYFNLVKSADNTGINKTWDAYTDLRDSPLLGGEENQIKDSLYFSDSVHLFCDGYKALAEYVYETGFLQLFQE